MLLLSALLGVLGRDPDATEGGLANDAEVLCEETGRVDTLECLDGSLALTASSKAFWISESETEGGRGGCDEVDEEKERRRPVGVLPGVGMPDVRGFIGVVAVIFQSFVGVVVVAVKLEDASEGREPRRVNAVPLRAQ